MPTYRAFLLEIEGNIIGPGENLDQDSDYNMQTHGQAVLAAGCWLLGAMARSGAARSECSRLPLFRPVCLQEARPSRWAKPKSPLSGQHPLRSSPQYQYDIVVIYR